jgi:hypothetical protein
LEQGPIYLKSNLFRQFASSLNVNEIFNIIPDSTNFNLTDFRKEVLMFSTEVADQIISDRNGYKVQTQLHLASGLEKNVFADMNVPDVSPITNEKPEFKKVANGVRRYPMSKRQYPILSPTTIRQQGGIKKSRKCKKSKKGNTRKQNKKHNYKNKTKKHKRVAHKKSRKHNN